MHISYNPKQIRNQCEKATNLIQNELHFEIGHFQNPSLFQSPNSAKKLHNILFAEWFHTSTLIVNGT